MAALVVVNSDCSKLSKASIKKAIRNKLTTITIYKIFIDKTTRILNKSTNFRKGCTYGLQEGRTGGIDSRIFLRFYECGGVVVARVLQNAYSAGFRSTPSTVL